MNKIFQKCNKHGGDVKSNGIQREKPNTMEYDQNRNDDRDLSRLVCICFKLLHT